MLLSQTIFFTTFLVVSVKNNPSKLSSNHSGTYGIPQHCALYVTQLTHCTLHYTLHCNTTLYTLHTTRCTLRTTHYTLHTTKFTLISTYILHTTHYTLQVQYKSQGHCLNYTTIGIPHGLEQTGYGAEIT